MSKYAFQEWCKNPGYPNDQKNFMYLGSTYFQNEIYYKNEVWDRLSVSLIATNYTVLSNAHCEHRCVSFFTEDTYQKINLEEGHTRYELTQESATLEEATSLLNIILSKQFL